jgi:hypothetical protein
MNATHGPLDRSTPVDTRLKICALWISVLFLFAYVDIFSLYRPGVLDDIRRGTIHTFDVTQTFLFLTTLYIVVPSVMVVLTLVMPPRLNRNTNYVVAGIYALTVLASAVGEWWYYVFASAVEVVLLLTVIRYARTLVGADAAHFDTRPNAE